MTSAAPYYARNRSRSRSSSPFGLRRTPSRVFGNPSPRRTANALFGGCMTMLVLSIAVPTIYFHGGWMFKHAFKPHPQRAVASSGSHQARDGSPDGSLDGSDDDNIPELKAEFKPFCNFISDKHWFYGTPTLAGTNAQTFCDLGRLCLDMPARNKELVMGPGGYNSVTLSKTCSAITGEEEVEDDSVLNCVAQRRKVMMSSLGVHANRIQHVKNAAAVSETLGALDPVEIPGVSYFFTPHETDNGCRPQNISDFLLLWLPLLQAKAHANELGIGQGLHEAEGMHVAEGTENKTNLILDARSADALNMDWQADFIEATLGSDVKVITFDDVVNGAGYKPVCFQEAVVFSRQSCEGFAYANETEVRGYSARRLTIPRDSIDLRERLYEKAGASSVATATQPVNKTSILSATTVKIAGPPLKVGVFTCGYIPRPNATNTIANVTERLESGLCFNDRVKFEKHIRTFVDKWRTIQVEFVLPKSSLNEQIKQMHDYGVIVLPQGTYISTALFLPPGAVIIWVGPDSREEVDLGWRNLAEVHSGVGFLSARSVGGAHPNEAQIAEMCGGQKTPCLAAKRNGFITADLSELDDRLHTALTQLRAAQPSRPVVANDTRFVRSTELVTNLRT